MKYLFLFIIVALALVFICVDGADKNKKKVRENMYKHLWVLRDLVDKICTFYQEQGSLKNNLLYEQCNEFVRRHQINAKEILSKLDWAIPAGGEKKEEFSIEKDKYDYIIDAYNKIIEILKSSNYPYRHEIGEIIKEWKEEEGNKINVYITGENPIKTLEL